MEDERAAASDKVAFEQRLTIIAPLIQKLGGVLPIYEPYVSSSFEDQVGVLIDAKVSVFSFVYGCSGCRDPVGTPSKGYRDTRTATTIEEALALERAGVDGIVASGSEVGGHRGSFLKPVEKSLIGTFSLVPQTADAVSVPVIAAGGAADSHGVRAAFALGASTV